MGMYIGYIDKKVGGDAIFFNFKPIAEVIDSQVRTLTSADLTTLLPESEMRNINFFFHWRSTENLKRMNEQFPENSLVVFDFITEDLSPNVKSTTGERNPTGYKVQALDMIDEKKIRPIHTMGVYYVIEKEQLLSDFCNDTIVEIDNPYVRSGDMVFVEFGESWVGPYEVGYREYTSSFYIKPQIKENKYTVSGYRADAVTLQKLASSDGRWGSQENTWTVLSPNEGASSEQTDIITRDVLLESFRDSLQDSIADDGQIKLDDIPTLLEHYEKSFLSGPPLTDKVRRDRLNHLVSILTAEQDVDETLHVIADFICDLLVKYQDSPNVEEWLQGLFEKHPDWMDRLESSKTISVRIAQMEQSFTDLQQKHAELEDEIEQKTAEAAKVDQVAVEAKKDALLQMDAEYTDLCAKLKRTKDELDVAGTITELLEKQNAHQKEVDYLETHQRRLQEDTKDLEKQFLQLINHPHAEMVGIAFDGFMASKMLQAAAQWEAEESTQQHTDLMAQIANNVPVSEKPPQELIDYLCQTIRTVRPTYSKNTIVNIAICLTQGFLTVFSGEPGCGKTSICNIFGEVLGLNKIAEYVDRADESKECINRYIPVSVERGWTSKRDFVGYYNPLSKTFDKSNRTVYDALYQLSTEKYSGGFQLPYIILLDEANLSPMEYYWSDFMNICDDLGPQSQVNLGEDHVFGIPETLHFLATINNDHTTETLSPRLIDRASIITLPQQHGDSYTEAKIPSEQIEIISWASLCQAFIPTPEELEAGLSAEAQRIYDAIISKLREQRFNVSPRIHKAVRRYWAVAAKHFVMDETKTDGKIVALDYAVAQRILPKIVGSGEEFEAWLTSIKSLCSGNGLNMSAKILENIIARGNQQMKYYQFF